MVTNLHEEWVRRLHEGDVREELCIAAEIEVRPVGGAGNVRVRELAREILTTRGVSQLQVSSKVMIGEAPFWGVDREAGLRLVLPGGRGRRKRRVPGSCRGHASD